MATIDVGGFSSRRDLNRELPLVPFIDFLLCIVAFLLVTAVWSEMARLDASAKVPGETSALGPEVRTPELHVDLRGSGPFLLEWRQGSTVLSQDRVAREPARAEGGVVRYPALAALVSDLWKRSGTHRSPID